MIKKLLAYYQYLNYLIRHRWFVMLACFKCGLIWRGLTHDLSKFLPCEFFPYAHFFAEKRRRNSSGYYKPTGTGDSNFDIAWLHHANYNKHHWQYWSQVQDDGSVITYPMDSTSIVEMVCDWIGAARAQGTRIEHGKELEHPRKLYEVNKGKMVLHNDSRWMKLMARTMMDLVVTSNRLTAVLDTIGFSGSDDDLQELENLVYNKQ